MHKVSKALRVAFVFLLPVFALAQGERGTLTGVVTDPTGALVPEAAISIMEMRTGVTTKVASSSAATIAYPFLQELTESKPARKASRPPWRKTSSCPSHRW